MKKLIFLLLKYGMKFLYFFMKLLTPVQNKAVFLSRQSDQPSVNFRMIERELQRADPQMQCEFYCRLGLKSEMGLSYALLMLRQMKALAGAKVCFTESYCIPISILKHKPHLKIIQIWHSMVAIKKFGWQTVDKPEGSSSDIAGIMQMHEGYDAVTVGSEYMRPFFAEAMRTPLEKILPLGMPSADSILAFLKDLREKDILPANVYCLCPDDEELIRTLRESIPDLSLIENTDDLERTVDGIHLSASGAEELALRIRKQLSE